MAEVDYVEGDPFPDENGGYVIAWTVLFGILWVLVAFGAFVLL